MWTNLPEQLYNGLTIGSGYALTAIGLTMIFGLMQVVNFAHGELYMLGAFMLYSFSVLMGLPFPLALVLAIAATAIVGLVCEGVVVKPLYGKPIDSTILLTIGLSIFLEHVALIVWGANPKTIVNPLPAQPIRLGSLTVSMDRLFILGVTSVIVAGLHVLLRWTTLGQSIRATFQDREAASLVGIEPHRVYRWTFVLGTMLAALGGCLMGSVFTVYTTMGQMANLKAFVVVIIGGLGSFPGAIVGGIVLGIAESLATDLVSSGYKDGIGFVIVIAILLLKPTGLFGKSREQIGY